MPKTPRLSTLPGPVTTIDTASVKMPKVADPFYASDGWKATRARVLARDRHRCSVEGCYNRAKVVDHIVSRRNGGTNADANLRSLCRDHDNRWKEDHMGQRRGGA